MCCFNGSLLLMHSLLRSLFIKLKPNYSAQQFQRVLSEHLEFSLVCFCDGDAGVGTYSHAESPGDLSRKLIYNTCPLEDGRRRQGKTKTRIKLL